MKHENMGTLLFDFRTLRKLSQGAVANKLGYGSSQFISNVERGLCLFPVKKFKKLAKVLDIDVELLVSAYMADVKEFINSEITKR
jgi:transcriptional regulator with XRE-family HTH domain